MVIDFTARDAVMEDIVIQPRPNIHDGSAQEKQVQEDGPSQETARFQVISQAPPASSIPPRKPDKPRPHVCLTCQRPFARLEHLKRHERSHTKEKPFGCQECSRAFARRDLLLRHQQKLHNGSTAAPRQRRMRRQSMNAGRVRKGSIASTFSSAPSNDPANMRPRANTISHVDASNFGIYPSADARPHYNTDISQGFSHHGSFSGLSGVLYHGLQNQQSHENYSVLPRLDTNSHNLDMSGGLSTASPPVGPNLNIGFENFSFERSDNTINPAQLHSIESPHQTVMDVPTSPFQVFGDVSATQAIMDDDDLNLDWADEKIDWGSYVNTQSCFGEQTIEGSSPSGRDTASQSGISELMLETSNQFPTSSGSMWMPSTTLAHAPNPFLTEAAMTNFSKVPTEPATIAPESLQKPTFLPEPCIPSSPVSLTVTNPLPHGTQSQMQCQSLPGPDSPSAASPSASSGHRHSSATSTSADSATDCTRHAPLSSLSSSHRVDTLPTRTYPHPTVSSSTNIAPAKSPDGNTAGLPTTSDLQRYVHAYIKYFHPHLPFLHIPTLSSDFSNSVKEARSHNSSSQSKINGTDSSGRRGCLVLSMAAIGALYEFESSASFQLFEAAKKILQLYLEERRHRAQIDKLQSQRMVFNNSEIKTSSPQNYSQSTPLWLIQSMLLNVIYGHNCGDKQSGDLASALVNLARAAELLRAVPTLTEGLYPEEENKNSKEEREWYIWKIKEERRRTLFAIFILSCLLVSAHNHPPTLPNSEIELDLPCDEDLWAAENAGSWKAKGGLVLVEERAVPFHTALATLLTAGSRQQQFQPTDPFGILSFGTGTSSKPAPGYDLRPSSFGCLVLINALHNYIWETRQHHLGRQWSPADVDSVRANVEPALRAWQEAWKSNPQHHCSRPNPYGGGPLSADCIPLLDLAYIRIFVNLGLSKKAFWNRDFDRMADEVARSLESTQSISHSISLGSTIPMDSTGSYDQTGDKYAGPFLSDNPVAGDLMRVSTQEQSPPAKVTLALMLNPDQKRERYLRKAAFYAVDSLSLSDNFGITFDHTSRELPIQSAICAFDCAQVLSEWATVLQERIGRFVGVLGKERINYTEVPACMYVDEFDIDLLQKMAGVIRRAELKMTGDIGALSTNAPFPVPQHLATIFDEGYGSKILRVTAEMLIRVAVWPVTRIMVSALQVQADHAKARAEKSIGSRRT